jgi:vacuolar-type H+-ATPase subunit F/Vma7
MSGRCVFIGDALSAAGYRLAGAHCCTPAKTEVTALLRRLCVDDDVALVMITAEYAAALPTQMLASALAEQRPPLLVVGDIRGRVEPDDQIATLKRQLGLAE